ncbi:MAG: tetratricopeptide repeat protein [Salinivirgaceae bacterium]|nr:tetratricopeptide repeat protein [Salinivirgaceae bacterium]
MRIKDIIIYFSIIVVLIFNQKNIEANQVYDSVDVRLQLITDNQAKIDYLLNLSIIFQQIDIEKAFESLEKAQFLVDKMDYDLPQANIFTAKGVLYKNRSDYPRAMDMFLKAIINYEEYLTDNKSDSIARLEYGNCLNYMGEVYFSLGRKDKAMEYLQSSIVIYKQLDNKKRLAFGLRNLGGIYFSNKMFIKALEIYLEALKYYQELGVEEGLPSLYSNIGAAYFTSDQLELSIDYFNIAEHKYLKAMEHDSCNTNWNKGISLVYFNKACYYNVLHNQKAYEQYLLKSLNILDSIYAPKESCAPALNLHQLYGTKGDYKKAYNYLLLYQSIQDSLYNIKKTNKISQLEKQYEFTKVQQDFELEKRKVELVYWMALSIMLFVLIVIILFFNQLKGKNRKVKIEKEKLAMDEIILKSQIKLKENKLKLKEKELKSLAFQIVEKDNSINGLQEGVNKMNTYLINEVNHEKISDIWKKACKSMKIDSDRRKFLLGMEYISKDLFRKLERDFHGLTKRELHIAALVKQEFTAKEIAVLFNISHKSAQTGKYRLKKRLNLLSDQSLEEFLKKY